MLQVTCKAYASTFVGNWTYWLLKESTEGLRKGCFLPPFPPHSRYRIKLRTTETAATWLYTKKSTAHKKKYCITAAVCVVFSPVQEQPSPFAVDEQTLIILWCCWVLPPEAACRETVMTRTVGHQGLVSEQLILPAVLRNLADFWSLLSSAEFEVAC